MSIFNKKKENTLFSYTLIDLSFQFIFVFLMIIGFLNTENSKLKNQNKETKVDTVGISESILASFSGLSEKDEEFLNTFSQAKKNNPNLSLTDFAKNWRIGIGSLPCSLVDLTPTNKSISIMTLTIQNSKIIVGTYHGGELMSASLVNELNKIDGKIVATTDFRNFFSSLKQLTKNKCGFYVTVQSCSPMIDLNTEHLIEGNFLRFGRTKIITCDSNIQPP